MAISITVAKLSSWKSNFHVHSTFCDGQEPPEAYILKAIQMGFDSLGFSSHAPNLLQSDWNMNSKILPLYVAEINRLKEKYRDRINIFTGLEVDYIYGLNDSNKQISFHPQKNFIDYRIGAVHFLPVGNSFIEVDYNSQQFGKILHDGYHSNIRQMIHTYYSAVRSMLKNNPPDIIAHLDLVKKFNQGNIFFDESLSWYSDEIDSTIELLSQAPTLLEVNTAPLYRGLGLEPFPSLWILKRCKEKGIRIILNSDAHSPEFLDGGYSEVIDMLEKVGYENGCVLSSPSGN